jgi:hypothetical protein
MNTIRNLHDLWLALTQGNPVLKECDERPEDGSHGITEIGIERTAGESTGGVYRAIIQFDGNVFYEGLYGVPHIGEHKGKIYPCSFDQLAMCAEEIQFFNLEDGYFYPVTCCPFVYTYVKKGDKQKVVQNYAGAGPRVLWAFEQLIDEALRNTKWERSVIPLPISR